MAKRSAIEPEYLIPLSPTDYQIMLALAGRSLHGLGIIRQALFESEGVIELSPGTVYPALRRLERFHYLKCIDKTNGRGSAHAKSIYELTSTGWLVLEQETSRIRRASNIAMTHIRTHAKASGSWSDTIKAL